MIFLSVLMAYALASQADPDREMAEVQVHEWGVITFGASVATAEARPDSAASSIPDYPVVERAPVVYFHGPEFTGEFTVTATDGVLLDLYPVEPGASVGNCYTWDIAAVLEWPEDRDSRRGLRYSAGGWDADLWAIPYSLWIRTSWGQEEGFLYYESSVNNISGFPVRYMQDLRSAIAQNPGMPAAVVVPGEEGPKVVSAEECCLMPALGQAVREARIHECPEDLLGIMYDWSVDIVDIDEVDAMWATWQGWFLDEGLRDLPEGSALLLYPLPADMQDEVSTIDLVTDQGFQVGYRRFLICAVPVTL
jgi:hypothetical protein